MGSSAAPTAPSAAPPMALTSAYPGLADYLGLELTEAEVRVLTGHGVPWYDIEGDGRCRSLVTS